MTMRAAIGIMAAPTYLEGHQPDHFKYRDDMDSTDRYIDVMRWRVVKVFRSTSSIQSNTQGERVKHGHSVRSTFAQHYPKFRYRFHRKLSFKFSLFIYEGDGRPPEHKNDTGNDTTTLRTSSKRGSKTALYNRDRSQKRASKRERLRCARTRRGTCTGQSLTWLYPLG
jgi:hypothetical protein